MAQLHSHPSRRLLFLLCSSLLAHLTSSSTVQRKRIPPLAEAQLAPSGISTRIIGGTLARVGRFDYFVRLVGPFKACGGALVARDIVITAAHCKADAQLETAEIGTYDYSINSQEEHPVRVIEEMFEHPSYITGENPYDDIMVIKLASPCKSLKVKFGEESACVFSNESSISQCMSQTL
jgi:secreted trypsin-like serine protease